MSWYPEKEAAKLRPLGEGRKNYRHVGNEASRQKSILLVFSLAMFGPAITEEICNRCLIRMTRFLSHVISPEQKWVFYSS